MGTTFEDVNVEPVIIIGGKYNAITLKISIGEEGIISYSHSKPLKPIIESRDVSLTVFSNSISENILNKLKSETVNLDDLVQIKAGLQAYEIGKGEPKQSKADVINRIYDFPTKIDDSTFPYLDGKDVQKYYHKPNSSFLKYGNNLAAPRDFKIFKSPKIIIREITGKYPNSIIACFTDEIILFNRSNIAINENINSKVNLKFILGILNSKLMSYYFKINTAKAIRKMFPKIILNDLRLFPIKLVPLEDQIPIIKIVDQIESFKKNQPNSDTISLESQIDQLVYQLYGLTEEEIGIVEGEER